MIRGCVNFGENYRGHGGGVPTEGAPARAAKSEPYGESSLAAFDHSSSKIVVVEDLLRSFAVLLGPPPETPFGQQVIVRSTLEVAAAAWYFADREADPRLLAGRVYNEHIENGRRNAALTRNVKDEESRALSESAYEEALSKIEEAFAAAESEGLSVLLTRKGDKNWVEEPRPSATELVRMAWSATQPTVGVFLYRFYSSVTHARMTAFLRNLHMEEEEEGRLRGQTFISLRDVELWTKIVVTAWADAMERLVLFAGWDQEMWKSWRLGATRSLAGVRLGGSSQ